MEDCIFCKIIAGEIPSNKIYEDEDVLAFLDIMPINPGHTLVIPKTHYTSVDDTPDKILEKLIVAVKKIGSAVKVGTGSPAYNIGLNNGKVAGQVVDHVHFHIMPRTADDGKEMWAGGKYKEDEAESVAEKIKEAL
ncbi:HIT family protein [Patescibacteria group bacterium]|nr:HIT family protein [Patescibacteria group bacterium]